MAQQDLYGDDAGSAPAAPSDQTKTEDQSAGTKTALIDSAICPGMEPGDEMVVKIEKVMDKEYLVSYAPEPADEGAPDEEAPPAEESTGMPTSRMASMME